MPRPLAEIRPKPLPLRNAAFKGEMTRIIFSVLKDRGKPINSRELTDMVFDQRGLGSANIRLRNTIQKRVSAARPHWRVKGVL